MLHYKRRYLIHSKDANLTDFHLDSLLNEGINAILTAPLMISINGTVELHQYIINNIIVFSNIF